MTLAPNVALFITSQSSSVKKLSDLKGKRVVVGPAGAGFEYFLEPILGAHGVSYQDFRRSITPKPVPLTCSLTVPPPLRSWVGQSRPHQLREPVRPQNIFFIPFDDTAKQELFENYPFFNAVVIPSGTYRGQDRAFSRHECRCHAPDYFCKYRRRDRLSIHQNPLRTTRRSR